jgi:peptide/nickel transport system substrate-binding protein
MDEPRVPIVLTRRKLLSLTGLAVAGVVVTACGGATATPTVGTTSTSTSTAGAAARTSSATSSAATSSAATSSAASSSASSSAATASAAATTASATKATTPAGSGTPAAGAKIPATFHDAPTLAEQVKAGKLPAVAQRVPKTPVVVPPVEKVGQFGGNWRSALVGGGDTAWLTRTIGYQNLLRWAPDWSEVIPNIAESYEANADATAFTFKLREGMKWSDGQPFGADDIVFYIEDIVLNKELTPSAGVNPPGVKKIDDQTVTITFEKPNGLFVQNLAIPAGEVWTQYPAHYAKQFHKKYADPAKLDQAMKENNAESWVKLFQLKVSSVPGTPATAMWSNPDLPTLHAWMITEPYGKGTRVIAERNPYFWKVDPDGNQLPYIDKVSYDVMQDAQPLLLKALNGEIDMQDRNIATNQNKPVIVDNQQKGQYHLFESVPSSMNAMIIYLNLTCKNPVLREIFNKKEFRIGLSYAINRQQIIDTVYVGVGEPWQAAPRPESEYYNKTLAKQYTEFDLAKANEYLDKVYPKKDGSGMRLGPDGKPISFVLEASTATPQMVDSLKLIQPTFKQVGVDMQMKVEDQSIWGAHVYANDSDAVTWGGDGGLEVVLEPRSYFPSNQGSFYAEPWYVWFVKPANPPCPPEEPPAAVKQQQDLYLQLQGTGDPAKQKDLMKQILEISADQFYCIGTSLLGNGYGIVKNNFHNVPKSMPGSWFYPNPAPTNPEQYFIAQQ